MSNIDMDFTSRDKIRTEIHSNFFVEAGAGSGKTSVLVDRMAAMVEAGIDISRICAITFTKAAAGEFYARFQKKLTESKSENAKRALENIDLCFMGTIDSFGNMALSEHPAEAGIPSNAAVVSDDEMAALYRRELSKIRNGQKGRALQEKYKKFRELFYNADEIFLKGISTLMSMKNARFNCPDAEYDKTVDELFAEPKKALLRVLRHLLEHPEAVILGKNKDADAAWNRLKESEEILFGTWDEDPVGIQKILKELTELRVMLDYGPALDEYGLTDCFVPHLSRNKPAWYVFDTDEDVLLTDRLADYSYAIAMDFIQAVVPLISEELRREGKLTFFDYLVYLRDLLKKDAAGDGKLIRHIYARHSYFLIDEFQDTNPIQAEIFFYLTAKEPDPDWKKCVPVPGSLFIVGDPKQSIYRFRNADVSSFIHVRELFTGEVGEVLKLTRNFRSSDNMCSWFNRVFSNMLQEKEGLQSGFEPVPTGEKAAYAASLNGAYLYEVRYAKALKDFEDPDKVVSIIQGLVNDPSVTIQERDDHGKAGMIRRPEYRDFMLITPGKSHLSAYMNAFLAAGIPFRVEGEVLFKDCPALLAVSRLLSAVADPFDRPAMFAATVLSGTGVTEEEIHAYALRARNMAPAAVCSMLLEEQRVFGTAGSENAEYLYFALELLREAEASGAVCSLTDGAAFIAKLVFEQSGEERCIQLKRDNNCVHIANLHKVKGLEAPIVILADKQKVKDKAESRVEYGNDEPESWIFSLPGGKAGDLISTSQYAHEKEAEEEVLKAEANRLLYVAATRAANVLIVSDVKKKDNTQVEYLWAPFVSYIDRDIFDEIHDAGSVPVPAAHSIDAEELYREAEETGALNDRASEEKSYVIRRPSMIRTESVITPEEEYSELIMDERPSEAARDPRLTGTIVHRLMEVLVSSGNQVDLKKAVDEILNEYGAEEPYYKETLLTVGEKVRSGGFPQENGAPQDILSMLLSSDEVYCEVPFCYREDEKTVWNGVMDVICVKNGSWRIVDYKTNADPSDLDEHYREQLDAYKRAFREMTGEDAEAMIYHLEV